MNSLEEERNDEAYNYAVNKGQISLDKLLKFKVHPTRFKAICWYNGYFVERGTKITGCGRHGKRSATMFYLIEKRDKRYVDGKELAACSMPKETFLTSSGEYKCLHKKDCQCYLNGNCTILEE